MDSTARNGSFHFLFLLLLYFCVISPIASSPSKFLFPTFPFFFSFFQFLFFSFLKPLFYFVFFNFSSVLRTSFHSYLPVCFVSVSFFQFFSFFLLPFCFLFLSVFCFYFAFIPISPVFPYISFPSLSLNFISIPMLWTSLSSFVKRLIYHTVEPFPYYYST